MNLVTEITGPVAVIGDVHGQVEKLGIVLDAIQDAPDFERRWVVFAGDFVDRGPDTRGCLDMVLEFLEYHPQTTAVAGNHDLAMAASLGLVPTPEYSNWSGRWLDHYNAQATFESYGVEFGDLEGLRQAMPVEQQQFLARLPWIVEHPQYLVVHAGLDPHTSCDMQVKILRQKDFTLNRPQWLCEKNYAEQDVPEDCEKTVISGHVWVPKVVMRRRKILCDTTGGVEGHLSAVLLPEMQVLNSGGGRLSCQPAAPAAHQAASAPAESRGWWKIW
ncbi:MAG: metallophosphoesterase [Planctomycetaceae bacterium]|nr:metallophosphoesterase [Planctomycetaceae bacterium]